MPGERRTAEDIRRELTAERTELADAIADLREGIEAKRRLATLVAGTLAAGVAVATALRVVRSLKDG